MAENKNLAKSLQQLKILQDEGHVVFHGTDELSRTHLERLLNAGFLKEVIRGWYIIDNPTNAGGDTVTWYSNFWKFVSIYETYNNGNNWCLSPEQTIDICSGNTVVPNQITVYVTKGGNRVITLLYGTSIFELRKNSLPEGIVTIKETGVNLWPLESAIANVSVTYWEKEPDNIKICLNSIKDISPIISALLENSSRQKSGYIIKALKDMGRVAEAEQMERILNRFGVSVIQQKTSPTQENAPLNKISFMWRKFRKQIVNSNCIPSKTGEASIASIVEKYKEDAYHSLSIEGYRISQALIDRVSSGKWSPKTSPEDLKEKNALVARGYYQAFNSVKKTIEDIRKDNLNPGKTVKVRHMDWYIDMWQPFVMAGLYRSSDIIGYRNRPVYIKNSRHVPPASEKVIDYMDYMFDCLINEPDSFVRAVLGHFFFTWIHPFNDGNGRMARFLMNTMLTTGDYPWVVVPVERRDEYMEALEEASVNNDITKFAAVIASLL